MNSIRVYLRDIRSEGLEIAEEIAAEDMGFSKDDYLHFVTPVAVKAKIERSGNTVLAQTHVQGKFSTGCARCLKEIREDLKNDFILDFQVKQETEFVEIADDVRQETVLNLPLKVLCREDCKGICPGCGVDLNEEACRCHKN